MFQIFAKVSAMGRVNLCQLDTRLKPYCLDSYLKIFEKKLTMNQLMMLHMSAENEAMRDFCYDSEVLDTLRFECFNEMMHLYKTSGKCDFFVNKKFLRILDGQIIVKGEYIKDYEYYLEYCYPILEQFKRIQGEFILALVYTEPRKKVNTRGLNRFVTREISLYKMCCEFFFNNRIKETLITSIHYKNESIKNVSFSYESFIANKKKPSRITHRIKIRTPILETMNNVVSKMKSKHLEDIKGRIESIMPFIYALEEFEDHGPFSCDKCNCSYHWQQKFFITLMIVSTTKNQVLKPCTSCTFRLMPRPKELLLTEEIQSTEESRLTEEDHLNADLSNAL